MNKVNKTIAALTLMLAFTGVAVAQIKNSEHDFSGKSWNSEGEICNACHTPHDGDIGSAQLWNHAVTVQSFTPYSSTTLDSSPAAPSGISKLCLSCHDGVTNLDAYGGDPGSSPMGGGAVVGKDLSNDHPISIDYTSAIASADGGLYDPSTAITSLGGTIADDLLFGGRLECASCHDVHNSFGNSHLLVIENAASALCLECHDK